MLVLKISSLIGSKNENKRISMKSNILMHMFLFRVHFTRIYGSIIYLSGYVERNPSAEPNSSQNITTDHWNLNTMTTHSFIKISLLKSYFSVHKFNMFCISETYLDLSTPLDNDDAIIYLMLNKWIFPLRILDIRFLQESMIFELQTGSKNVHCTKS